MEGRNYEEEVRRLVNELFSKSSANKRCPYIRRDDLGPYCCKGIESITQKRRDVCDHLSLQIWCLADSYKNCCWYKGTFRFDDIEPLLN